METRRIGLSWALSGTSGWGVFGLNLTLELLKGRGPQPLLFTQPAMAGLSGQQKAILAPLIAEQAQIMETIRSQGGGLKATMKEVVILHALINRFQAGEITDLVAGRRNVGFIFFEDAYLDGEARQRAGRYDCILVGSTWNLEVLRESGIRDARLAIQGIDPILFHPGPAAGAYGDRFVIFSGGKLEFRKGQDIVIAAFREFHRQHPDSILVTAWQNHWPETAKEMSLSPHMEEGPGVDGHGQLAIGAWAEANGIPSGAVIDLGWVRRQALPAVLRDAHVGLFPNRAEGGTNLVAMEAMACGLPCILSANTGHLDLISGDNCYPLGSQPPVASQSPNFKGWGESSVDEIVAALEQVYQDREEAIRRGLLAAEFMREFTWSKRIAHLMEAIEDLL